LAVVGKSRDGTPGMFGVGHAASSNAAVPAAVDVAVVVGAAVVGPAVVAATVAVGLAVVVAAVVRAAVVGAIVVVAGLASSSSPHAALTSATAAATIEARPRRPPLRRVA